MFKLRDGNGMRFAELMDRVSEIAPEVRFRFTSPHPKDFPDALLNIIATRPNVCK
jgi:tRNA A37 methylthiotransferase MiaB